MINTIGIGADRDRWIGATLRIDATLRMVRSVPPFALPHYLVRLLSAMNWGWKWREGVHAKCVTCPLINILSFLSLSPQHRRVTHCQIVIPGTDRDTWHRSGATLFPESETDQNWIERWNIDSDLDSNTARIDGFYARLNEDFRIKL